DEFSNRGSLGIFVAGETVRRARHEIPRGFLGGRGRLGRRRPKRPSGFSAGGGGASLPFVWDRNELAAGGCLLRPRRDAATCFKAAAAFSCATGFTSGRCWDARIRR